jgi:hypothetical protein
MDAFRRLILSPYGHKVLGEINRWPKPAEEINPGLRSILIRRGLVRTEAVQGIGHAVITKRGRQVAELALGRDSAAIH